MTQIFQNLQKIFFCGGGNGKTLASSKFMLWIARIPHGRNEGTAYSHTQHRCTKAHTYLNSKIKKTLTLKASKSRIEPSGWVPPWSFHDTSYCHVVVYDAILLFMRVHSMQIRRGWRNQADPSVYSRLRILLLSQERIVFNQQRCRSSAMHTHTL